MRKPILYILCGCPGCGKTYWANKFMYNLINTKYVSRDEIRLSLLNNDEEYFSHEEEVFTKFVAMIRANLVDGYDCIADATHLNVKSRKKLIHALDFYGKLDCQIIFVYFNAPLEVCLGRNEQREGRARVPVNVIQSMRERFQKPAMTEDERCIGLMLMKGY